jgi:predicted amidohydrolase
MKYMESSKVRLALAQMTSTTSIRQNEKDARRILAEAKAGDAGLVTFPECPNLIQRDPKKVSFEIRFEEDDLFTYGHSLVADPWGEVLLDGDRDPAIHHVTLDLTRVTSARCKIPLLINERPYIQPC